VRVLILAGLVAATGGLVTAAAWGGPAHKGGHRQALTYDQILPAPVSVDTSRQVFRLDEDAAVYTGGDAAGAKAAADFLAGLLRKPTGYELPVRNLSSGEDPEGIALYLGGADSVKEKGGYKLQVTDDAVTIRANDRAGLFNGVETLRQLMPYEVDAGKQQSGPWYVQGGEVLDHPRYHYRGALLDVARNFQPVASVKRYIDTIARYKINYLHLHLADDQGWRVQIDARPKLTEIGGSSGVGGVSSGFYTKDEYKDIVQYASARGVTVVPEIEGPDHMHAALASYAELNCDGVAPPVYTGFLKSDDGLLCIDKDVTYTFLDQVIGELAEMTPGPYIQIGGDETQGRSAEDLQHYMQKVNALVEKHGKKVFGWSEAAGHADDSNSMIEFWAAGVADQQVLDAAESGAQIVMAPSKHAYLDAKYTENVPEYPHGMTWRGTTDVKDSYDWQPDGLLEGLAGTSIAGVEATNFTETTFGIRQVEMLAFPRLLSVADIGWAPKSSHDWAGFEKRLAAQGPRLRLSGVNYYRAPGVDWVFGS
jgi:hexosaminidase